jgi:hypothetical protein
MCGRETYDTPQELKTRLKTQLILNVLVAALHGGQQLMVCSGRWNVHGLDDLKGVGASVAFVARRVRLIVF